RNSQYVELYDLVTDPFEKNDLKGKHQDKVKQLKKMLTEWQESLPKEPTGNVFSKLREKK
ncbi:MAG: N-acetylgalactosamine-6-sulfatase, partial [Akkermansiaceae bacterium]|nr:N-acetylgalactosamine-6-sulfatase [Akkermansiaceae bacterium]